jgi:hypothetical protein
MSPRSWKAIAPFGAVALVLGCSGTEGDSLDEPRAGAAGTPSGSGGSSGAAGANTSGTSSGSGGSTPGAAGSAAASGAPTTGGTAGSAAVGGAAGQPSSTGGTSATGGMAGLSGNAGNPAGSGGATPGACSFEIEGSPSSAIPTVGIVEWTTDLANLTEARIEFTLDDAAPDELNQGSGGPIDVSGSTHRALLLGMKAGRTYTYRIVATGGGTVCTSADQTITTGSLPAGAPSMTRDVQNAAAIDAGFIITSAGTAGMGGGMGGGGMGGGMQVAYIFDADGDVVWAASAPASCSRALMSYEGTDMWMLELNVDNGGGEMRRVSMDGLDVAMNVEGLSAVHHDFTVLPGGIVAGPSWVSSGRDPPSDLIERSPDGTVRTVVTIDEGIYQSNSYHTNAIVYYAEGDFYTLGDRNPNAFVKVSRTGEVLWQFGGSCNNAPAPLCAAGDWQVNHGHHLLPDNHFVFFNNGSMNGGSTAFEYALSEGAGSLTTSMVWSYSASGVSSMVLGDVQRLPGGNTLVIYSNDGVMHEVDSAGELVQAFSSSASTFGYANFRKTLYGPPLR